MKCSMGKQHNEIQMLEASLSACLRNALAARQRLSAARDRHGLRDRLAFLTRDEVDELRAEHKQVVAGLIAGPSPTYVRMAKLFMAAKKSGAMTRARSTVDFYKAVEEAADVRRRRREEKN